MESYEVVVVRYTAAGLKSWREVPTRFIEVSRPLNGLSRPLANAWVRAFNMAELRRPYGVWALLRGPK